MSGPQLADTPDPLPSGHLFPDGKPRNGLVLLGHFGLFGHYGSGKSYLALHLANMLAERGERVLWLDRWGDPSLLGDSSDGVLAPAVTCRRLDVTAGGPGEPPLTREAVVRVAQGEWDLVIIDSLERAIIVGGPGTFEPSVLVRFAQDLAERLETRVLVTGAYPQLDLQPQPADEKRTPAETLPDLLLGPVHAPETVPAP